MSNELKNKKIEQIINKARISITSSEMKFFLSKCTELQEHD